MGLEHVWEEGPSQREWLVGGTEVPADKAGVAGGSIGRGRARASEVESRGSLLPRVYPRRPRGGSLNPPTDPPGPDYSLGPKCRKNQRGRAGDLRSRSPLGPGPVTLNPVPRASRPLSCQGARICREQKRAFEGSFQDRSLLGPQKMSLLAFWGLAPGCEQGPGSAPALLVPEKGRGLGLGPWGHGRASRLRPERVMCTRLQVLPPQSGQAAEVHAWLHVIRE